MQGLAPNLRPVVAIVCGLLLAIAPVLALTAPETLALADLYSATGGANWKSPWTLSGQPCSLPGVTCLGDSVTYVTELGSC